MYQITDEKIIGRKVDTNSDFLQLKVVHIVCDTAASVPEPLPEWAAGSRCDVLANSGNVYILSISGEWKQVNFYNRGGSGGDFDPDNYYTKPQTDARITEKVAEIVAEAPEDFDTLKEMSDWISQHEESAAAMNTAIAGKVDKVSGKSLSTNDYTTTEKNKLAGIKEGANKTVVDSALSSSSTNPVQNKVIKESLDNKVDKVSGKGLSTNDYTAEEKNKLANLENYDDSDLRKWVNEESGYGKITICKSGTHETTYDSDLKKLHFEFRMLADAFQEIKQAGLIATSNSAIKYQLTLDTPPETGVTYVKTLDVPSGIYGLYYDWTKTNVEPGDTWYIVPYMKYDSGDDSYLKYGPLYSVTANSDSTVSITTISPATSNVMYDVLHPSNFTITKQSSVSTDTITYTARCIGNIVIINICIQTGKAWTASGNKGIATIPASYRPSITYVTGDVMVSETYESARAWINASAGQLQMKYDFEIPANATITMAFAYSIGDTATAS